VPRLLIHVEGETEETFVNEVLGPHLRSCGFAQVSARLLGNARQRLRRGGIRSWPAVKKDIVNHLHGDSGCLASTMVDYYALPRTGPGAWPGRDVAGAAAFPANAELVERALHADICQEMGSSFDPQRFVPFVMMHEFEAILFSDCLRFAEGIGRTDLAEAFQSIRSQFSTPEEIDDSPETAPSKRIESVMPGYSKVLFGNLAALEIGLAAIRSECPHFRRWLEALESRPAATAQ